MLQKNKNISKKENFSQLLQLKISNNSSIDSVSRSKILKLLPLKYDLKSRIRRYNLIQKTLLKLKKDFTTNTCLENNYYNQIFKLQTTYKIKDIITLAHKIGSQSAVGSIYKTVIHNNPINIATKVMYVSSGNILETKLMKAITEQIILTKKSKHFIIMYCYSLCSEIMKINYALANFNELAVNDIYHLFKEKKESSDELYNILIQSFLSIGSFHNLTGYIHTDCHSKNFLYINNTENKDNGYYHYVFNNKNYYLKSCKYNVMIYDFGHSKYIGMNNNELRDYIIDITIFVKNIYELSTQKIFSIDNHINSNIEYYKNLIIIKDYTKILYDIRYNIKDKNSNIIEILTEIVNKLNKINLKFKNSYNLLKNIFIAVLKICLEYFPQLFFTDIEKLPSGSIILNKDNPYELYSKSKIVLMDL
jgi:hypothetical protein